MKESTTTSFTTSEKLKCARPLCTIEMNQHYVEFQDLGELTKTLRTVEGIGPSGVEVLRSNDDSTHSDAMEDFRAVVDGHYSDAIDELAGDAERVIIERIVIQSDERPYIEYSLVDEVEE
jgi:hypothetical protein